MIKSLPCERIREVFSALSQQEDANEVLIAAAAEGILCRIKKSADPDIWTRPLCYAAGCLAYYRFCLSANADNTTAFKAGDITVNTDSSISLSAAERLLGEAMESIRPVLRGEFCFLCV